jgi:hypothetical protein
MNKIKAYSQVIENALFDYGKATIVDTGRLIQAYFGLFNALDDAVSGEATETTDLDYEGLSYALGLYYYIVQDNPSSLNWKNNGCTFTDYIKRWDEHVFDEAPIDSVEYEIRTALLRFDSQVRGSRLSIEALGQA